MGIKEKVKKALVFILIIGMAATANAASLIIDFEEAPYDDHIYGVSYLSKGFFFENFSTSQFTLGEPTNVRIWIWGNGTKGIINPSGLTKTVMTQSNGSPFTVHSLWAGYGRGTAPTSITFTGVKSDGSEVTQTVTIPGIDGELTQITFADFDNLTSFSWQSGFSNHVDDILIDDTSTIDVEIDINRGSDDNCININGHGVIPVTILGAENFDVNDINVDTLSFQGLKVRVRGNKGPLCSIEHSNDDDYLDMVCHFEDNTEEWLEGSSTGTLTGNLINGTLIEGTDSICIVP